ncbi:MAG: phage portal protein [Ruminococcus sp.]|nr:phage portal protein [Ruminococcus sp.]
MIFDKAKEAFEDTRLPELSAYYGKIDEWADIFSGRPKWRRVKRSGLAKAGERQLNQMNTGKILCDEFGHKLFGEQVEISCGNEAADEFIKDFLEREGFWQNIPAYISKAFAQGGCGLREYIENGRVRLGYCEGRQFIPLKWDNKRITECIFADVSSVGEKYYTLFERHYFDGKARVETRLFRSEYGNDLGRRVPLTELFPNAPDTVIYPSDVPVFQYFKPDITNSFDEIYGNIPLGQSVLECCRDTLKALDIAFDSFAREFVLGKKRIIVPSSCIRTVVDPDTGEVCRYFDADDEVYQALKCDEEKDLKINDNTVELRITEHVDGINALLNILCFQTGLSPGALSFDRSGGMKTATEVVSENSKTALTLKCNKNLLTEFFGDMLKAVIALAQETGELPRGGYEISVGFKDSVIIDDNTLIDNNIKLVSAGLKSKVSAIMEILKCDEETAKKELARINEENSSAVMGGDETFDPSDDEADSEDIVEEAEKEAGKTLNSAQTQSLISVMAQYKAGTLSLGQAVNIVSVSIGISKEEARKIIEGAE